MTVDVEGVALTFAFRVRRVDKCGDERDFLAGMLSPESEDCRDGLTSGSDGFFLRRVNLTVGVFSARAGSLVVVVVLLFPRVLRLTRTGVISGAADLGCPVVVDCADVSAANSEELICVLNLLLDLVTVIGGGFVLLGLTGIAQSSLGETDFRILLAGFSSLLLSDVVCCLGRNLPLPGRDSATTTFDLTRTVFRVVGGDSGGDGFE